MTLEDLANYQDKFSSMNLRELAVCFLEKHNFMYNEAIQGENRNELEKKIDFIITGQKNSAQSNIKTGLIVKDYKKSTGSDTICQIERLLKDLKSVSTIILLANEFSVPARNLAERCGVPTISRGELISMLWNPNKF
jgi:hypothetical protein